MFQYQSLHILLSVDATFALVVWSRDVTQAYVQRKALSIRVHLNPEHSFGLAKGRTLRIIGPLYGISDAGGA